MRFVGFVFLTEGNVLIANQSLPCGSFLKPGINLHRPLLCRSLRVCCMLSPSLLHIGACLKRLGLSKAHKLNRVYSTFLCMYVWWQSVDVQSKGHGKIYLIPYCSVHVTPISLSSPVLCTWLLIAVVFSDFRQCLCYLNFL